MLFYAAAHGDRRALCVTLATVHVPLADVPRLLTHGARWRAPFA